MLKKLFAFLISTEVFKISNNDDTLLRISCNLKILLLRIQTFVTAHFLHVTFDYCEIPCVAITNMSSEARSVYYCSLAFGQLVFIGHILFYTSERAANAPNYWAVSPVHIFIFLKWISSATERILVNNFFNFCFPPPILFFKHLNLQLHYFLVCLSPCFKWKNQVFFKVLLSCVESVSFKMYLEKNYLYLFFFFVSVTVHDRHAFLNK